MQVLCSKERTSHWKGRHPRVTVLHCVGHRQVMGSVVSSLPTLAERTRRHVDRRLMPFVFLLFVISYLDRVNVGFAGLQMTRELGFSNYVFGLGGGIFFIGYFLLEVPGSILAEVWSARKWIARIMITCGVGATLTGLISR